MQEGSFRCDANVSVRPLGQAEFGTRCEIKNLNSFKFLEEAIQYEVRRQIELIEDGGKVVQETRLYDPDRKETRSMRTKEDANDYRYFPDPDLLPLVISDAWVEKEKNEMGELPSELAKRWQAEYALTEYDTQVLTQEKSFAHYYQELVARLSKDQAKTAANFLIGDFASALNKADLVAADAPVNAEQLALLIQRISDGTISNKIAKDIFTILWDEKASDANAVDRIIEAKGLKQISDSGALAAIVDEVLAKNQKSIDEFKAGKEKAFNALVGQIMKATQGKANPQQVNKILTEKLGAL